jgi:hypothetical protein
MFAKSSPCVTITHLSDVGNSSWVTAAIAPTLGSLIAAAAEYIPINNIKLRINGRLAIRAPEHANNSTET